MNLLNDNGSRLYRFVAGWLGVASASTSVTCLIILCLAVLMTFLGLACNGPTPTEPPPHIRTPTPMFTDTPSPTVTPIPSPTLFPPVMLTEPEDGAEFDWGSEITLGWSYPDGLQDEEYYRLRGRAKGPHSFLFYPDEDHFTLFDLSPGKYDWAVAVLRSIGEDMYVLASEESNWWSFTVAPPIPVVHSISPTVTVQGTSVPMVVSGDNLTLTLTVTIGDVALKVTFVNSSTITATIPITLEAGQHPVIVRDSLGQGESHAFFTVSEPPTPIPTLPSYSSPNLIGIDILGCSVTFKWDWNGRLAPDEWFAVRLGKGDEIPESIDWVKGSPYKCDLGDEADDYSWQIAICRGNRGEGSCPKPLAISERQVFEFQGCQTRGNGRE